MLSVASVGTFTKFLIVFETDKKNVNKAFVNDRFLTTVQ